MHNFWAKIGKWREKLINWSTKMKQWKIWKKSTLTRLIAWKPFLRRRNFWWAQNSCQVSTLDSINSNWILMRKRRKIQSLPVSSNSFRENLQSAKICSKMKFQPTKHKLSLWKTKMSFCKEIWKRIKTLSSCYLFNLKKRKPNFKANWLRRLLLWENDFLKLKTNWKGWDWSFMKSRTRKWLLRENCKTWRTSLTRVWLKQRSKSNCAFRRHWELETTKMWSSAIRIWTKRIGTCWPNWTSSTKSWRKLKKLINFWRKNRFRSIL